MRETLVPYLRENDPANNGLPIRDVAKVVGLSVSHTGVLVNRYPRYLETERETASDGRSRITMIRRHRDIA